jgi:hypothetical protein
MPDGTSQLGKIDTQIAAEGGTAEPFAGTFTFQYTRDSCHLLRQPLFSVLSPSDPSFSFQFATNYTWQAQLGWTLVNRKFMVIGQYLDFSLEQSVARQFGEKSKERAVIANMLQGQLKYKILKSHIYAAIEGGFAASHQDDGKWKVGLNGAFKIGWEIDFVFK